jgi:SPP1 gp7 family putative phage head morphogenesis protein
MEISTYIAYDPTRTTSLRNLFAKDVHKRFGEFVRVIRESIVTQDCFGLTHKAVATHQVAPTGSGAFTFMRDPEKVEAFMRWLRQQEEKGLLTIGQFEQIGRAVNEAWTNRYILDSYKRGVMRARYELQKAGVPPLENTGGIEASMGTPFHMDRVGLLFTRVFSQLQGITAAMDSTISQVLAQGMIDGDGPALIARKIIATIDGRGLGDLGITDKLGRFIPAERRAIMLARTETIRAFHLAAIQEYRNWAVVDVYVQAEWMTAGDNKVCPECAKMEYNADGTRKIYSLDEIEPLIPLHPFCRCIALPYLEELKPYYSNKKEYK